MVLSRVTHFTAKSRGSQRVVGTNVAHRKRFADGSTLRSDAITSLQGHLTGFTVYLTKRLNEGFFNSVP